MAEKWLKGHKLTNFKNLQRFAQKIFMYCDKIILNKYKHISSLIMFISNHNKV